MQLVLLSATFVIGSKPSYPYSDCEFDIIINITKHNYMKAKLN